MSRTTGLLLGLALVYVALQLGAGRVEPYGLFHDELYYWACARRLGLGYVDHPPLAPWLLAASQTVLGDSWLGFGLVPALCGAGTLVLAGLMARRFGAGRFGQLLAALCVMVAPFYLAFFSFYSVNALELLLWTAASFVWLELIRTRDERLWAVFGLVAGLALLNKHTFVLLGAALGLGMLATPLRVALASRWLWLGAGIAALLALPNLWWNATNDWPSLAFYRSVASHKNIPTSLREALGIQVVGMNPAAVLVWLPGLLFLLVSRRMRPYRSLGLAFAVLLLWILTSGLRRGDRIAGVYPVVLAAGATFWDQWAQHPWQRRARLALPALLVGMGVLVLPASLPVLPPEQVAAYFEAIDESPEIEPHDVGHAIPLHLLGRLEWQRVAAEAVAAWATLSPDERARAVVLAPHWVVASVVEYYGRHHDLPPVVSPHNAYFLWRHEADGRDLALAVGIPRETLAESFGATREVGHFRCEHCASWRPDMPIFVATQPTRPIPLLLEQGRTYGN